MTNERGPVGGAGELTVRAVDELFYGWRWCKHVNDTGLVRRSCRQCVAEILEPIVAGALAAVRLEEARWWDENVGEYDRFEEAAERLLALERAVEGK